AQVVLADGRVVECDEGHDPELFWALRGAGSGNFGVVTSFVFRTRAASSATNFHLAWPSPRAVAVIDAWQAWAPTAPDELHASLLVTAGRDVKRPPTVELFGSLLGTERDASELLDDLALRVGADPRTDFRSHMSPQETARYWAAPGAADRSEQDERQQSLEPEHLFLKSEFFRHPMPRPAITAL